MPTTLLVGNVGTTVGIAGAVPLVIYLYNNVSIKWVILLV